MSRFEQFLKISIIILAFAFLVKGLAVPIDLSTADLGRHISNGRQLVQAINSHADLKTQSPLYTNFYSYTQPDYPVINHHWLSGLVHYVIYELGGFDALAWTNILCILLGLCFSLMAARELSNSKASLGALALALPLLIMRAEVRPESFSYLLLGLVLYLLVLLRAQRLKPSLGLVFIALLQMLWINLHLFFIFGLFLIFCFGLETWLKSRSIISNLFFRILACSVLLSLLNPFGLANLLEPFNIFKDYGYMLAENQSVFFMQHRFPSNPFYYYFEFFTLVSLVLWVLAARKIKNPLPQHLAFALIYLIFIILAFKTNRAIPVLVLSSIPMIAMNLSQVLASHNASPANQTQNKTNNLIDLPYYFLILLYLACLLAASNPPQLGLDPRVHHSAVFFKATGLRGPIFNNYDIGGYLIYHLFPQERVFVDNRPEAYGAKFFHDVYEPMQADENKWQEADNKYHFNVIYFMRHDLTSQAQPFLLRRIADPDWVPVFVDAYNIIIIKRNDLNAPIIQRYALSKSLFIARANPEA